MPPSRHPLLAILILLVAISAQAAAQSGDLSIDPTLAAQIAAIPAIDNHAHPMLSPPAYATDRIIGLGDIHSPMDDP